MDEIRLTIDLRDADVLGAGGGESYTLPTMTSKIKGGAKAGENVTMVGDTLNVVIPESVTVQTGTEIPTNLPNNTLYFRFTKG